MCVLITTEGGESPGLYEASSDTPQWGGDGACYCQVGAEVRAPYSVITWQRYLGEVRLPLGLCWHGWEWGYIFFYGVGLKHSGYCLGVFCFANLPVPCPLAKKCWLLLGLFNLPVGCFGLPASSAPHLGYMTSEKNNNKEFITVPFSVP